MKQMLIVCALTVAVASPSASQPALGQANAERSRKEALQHYRLGQDAMRNERFDIAEKEFQKSATLDPRRPGVVGLYLRIAMSVFL